MKYMYLIFGLLFLGMISNVFALSDTNLLNWWKLNETSGTNVVADKNSYFNGTLTLANGAIGVPGKIGTSYWFHNTSTTTATDYVSVPIHNKSSNFTISTWIKTNSQKAMQGIYHIGVSNGCNPSSSGIHLSNEDRKSVV